MPVVQRTVAPEEFPGLYCGSLAQDAFLGEPTMLAISLALPGHAVIWKADCIQSHQTDSAEVCNTSCACLADPLWTLACLLQTTAPCL